MFIEDNFLLLLQSCCRLQICLNCLFHFDLKYVDLKPIEISHFFQIFQLSRIQIFQSISYSLLNFISVCHYIFLSNSNFINLYILSFLLNMAKDLSILLIYSKKQLSIHCIFSNAISLISALLLIISCLLLLDLLCTWFLLGALRYIITLFIRDTTPLTHINIF